MAKARASILVLISLCWAQPQSGRADASVPQAASQSGVEVPSAAEPAKYADFETALRKQMHKGAEVPLEDLPKPPAYKAESALMVGLGALVAFLFGNIAFRVAKLLNKRFKFWVPKPAVEKPNEVFPNLLAEDEGFVELMRAMKDTLGAGSAEGSSAGQGAAVQHEPAAKLPAVEADPMAEFLAEAAERIAAARKLFSELGRAADAPARQAILARISEEVGWLKINSEHPEWLPAWQMAAALEGLLNQLTRNAANVTASALRTVGGALDLLQNLCIRGVKPNLTKKPPVRLLAVDDDAVSRNAVSMALRKIFPEPALAADGEAALELAAQHPYDVIFLDVEMPGIDGFETCSKIHATEANRTTPVVFVTRHTDFDSRARSTLTGGEDLIGKPFLAFEITVKALTLVMRGRLGKKPVEARANDSSAGKGAAVVPGAPSAVTNPVSRVTAFDTARTPVPAGLGTRHSTPVTLAPEPAPAEFAKAFFTHGPAHLEEIRNRLQLARDAGKPAELQDFIGELYVDIHSLRGDVERAQLPAVLRLVSALEAMLKKLLEQPKLFSSSTLDTAAATLELLEKLCRAEACPDVANPSIRILVVDDDPVALRAVVGSVQTVFGRPESAASGEAALALASEEAFDLIFLDVLMPGLDGFATCSGIREIPLNCLTPVVFVTSHSDQQARLQATAAGGSGFISKPVLSSQITLAAWTFILRGRLEKPTLGRVAQQVREAVLCSQP